MVICLSEKDFEIITFKSSSVGKSIPKDMKLFNLDFKSTRLISKSFNGICVKIKTAMSSCLVKLSNEKKDFSSIFLLRLSIMILLNFEI